MSWQEISLGDAVKEDGGILQTGPFGSQLKQSEYAVEGVPVIMPKDIRNGEVIQEEVARVPEATAERLSRHRVSEGGVILPRRGEVSKRAFIKPDQVGWICGTGCLKIEVNGIKVWPRFLYYYLGLPSSIDWLLQNAVGSTMLNLSAEIVSRFPLRLPSIDVQKKLADIMSNYDEAIENNQRRIQLLEESARLLYKEWFVHLRFPGHEHVKVTNGVPKGWSRKSLGDIATLNYGKALKKDARNPGPYPVFGSSGVVGEHDKAFSKGPAIIVGRKGNVGSVYWSDKDFYPIDTVYFVLSEQSSAFLYHSLKNTQFISTDVAVPGLNRNFAHSREILVPDDKVLMIFEEYAQDIQAQVAKLGAQNESLAKARDLLLPKLMSGELAA